MLSRSVSGGACRVVSGMRATGKLHLGHYHGVLKNWVKLQHEYECFYFVADWHALTTHYAQSKYIENNVWDMVIDWLAAGINPGSCKLFIQSRIPEHAELHLLLSMITPLAWLERVPTYKDQQAKLKNLDLSTYGFLGYPLLQSADVLVYKGGYVPVGEDQIPHVELMREVARRFNYLYGCESGYEKKAQTVIEKMGKKNAKLYRHYVKTYQEKGDEDSLENGRALVKAQANLSLGDTESLLGFIEGTGKIILPEPQVLVTKMAKFPGLDGRKMSKSYNNTIELREAPESVTKKIEVMPTDPARVRRSDPGEPNKCPVWPFHCVYSDDSIQKWVLMGCRSAKIGCLDCKHALIPNVLAEQKPIIEKAKEYIENPRMVKEIIREGCEAARCEAKETLAEVREVIGLPNRDK